METCPYQRWLASGRVRGWGHFVPCGKSVVKGQEFCATHLRVERRNECRCEKCGADAREVLQVGGRTLGLSKSAWAYCACGHLTKFGADNRAEMVKRERVSSTYSDLQSTEGGK